MQPSEDAKEGIRARPNLKLASLPVSYVWRQHRCILHCLWYPTILCFTCEGWAKRWLLKVVVGGQLVW